MLNQLSLLISQIFISHFLTQRETERDRERERERQTEKGWGKGKAKRMEQHMGRGKGRVKQKRYLQRKKPAQKSSYPKMKHRRGVKQEDMTYTEGGHF